MTPRELAGAYKIAVSSLQLIAGGAQRLVSSNPDRVYLLFAVAPGQGVTISPRSDVTNTNGIPLTTTVPVFTLSIKDAPALVQSEWYVNAGFGGFPIEIIEVVPTGAEKQPGVN